MNVLEQMMMQGLMTACDTKPQSPEEVMGNKQALEAVKQIIPENARAVIVMAVLDETNDAGQRGVQLVTGMAGSEKTIDTLLHVAQGMVQMQHIKRCHPEELESNPLLSALMSGESEIDAVDVHQHFGGCGGEKH